MLAEFAPQPAESIIETIRQQGDVIDLLQIEGRSQLAMAACTAAVVASSVISPISADNSSGFVAFETIVIGGAIASNSAAQLVFPYRTARSSQRVAAETQLEQQRVFAQQLGEPVELL